MKILSFSQKIQPEP